MEEGTMLSTVGSADRRACQLPAAVERELAQLERQRGQRADQKAQERLAGLGEAAAVWILRRIGDSRQTVRNLSAYIQFMAERDDSECAVVTSRSGDNVFGTVNHHVHISFDLPSQDRIEAGSPTRSTPYRLQLQGSPGRGLVSGSQHQVGTVSPVRQATFSPPRMASTPSPVRNITNSLSQWGAPSRTIGFETPPTPPRIKPGDLLANANELPATVGDQMAALGALEFDKIFLIYVYLAGNKIEYVCELHEEYIRSLYPLSMDDFESEIWHKFGHRFIAETERRKNLDWEDPKKTKVYKCFVEKRDEATLTIFKGPYFENAKNHLQKVVGDDNILQVNFSEMPGHKKAGDNCGTYGQVAEEGIILGLRRYRFLIYKDGGNEGKRKQEKGKNDGNHKYSSSVKCYFIRTESGWHRDEPYIFSNKEIGEVRNSFMHIHTVPTVAKYVARFSLIFSKTTTLLDADDLSNVKVTIIEDLPCKDENGNVVLNHGETLIHTDGTGLISEDLATKCPTSVFKGKVLRNHDLQPLLMQVRMFYDGLAVKGTLLVDRRLPAGTIQIRPSMIKVKSDISLPRGQCFNSLEIVSTSNRPKRAFTSRSLITLLHYGGVPAKYFVELVGKALQDVDKAFHKAADALEVAYNHADMDDAMSARMILSGVQPEADAYLKHQLTTMVREEREGIKLGRIPIDESYNLMGTIDPTGTLKPNEVCVIHENGQVSGEVLVYRYPGLHFGDVHVLTATPIPNLEKNIVGFSKYGILFPISGPRPLADEMAGGDYDGDMFFVSRNPQLLEHFRPSKPWVQRNPPRKTEQKEPRDESQLEILLFLKFLEARFAPSPVMGIASDCWLAHMDQLLTDEVQENKGEWELIKAKMLELVDIYYEALDAPKTGNKVDVPDELRVEEYPHYMERKKYGSYHSTSVLGKIYDEAISRQSETIPTTNIISLLSCFTEEVELVPDGCREEWTRRYDDYRKESSALCDANYSKEETDAGFSKLYQKYREMLYHAKEFDESPRKRQEVFGEACLIYQIVYEYAIRRDNVKLCGFAWKVAGRALCQLHAIKRGGETVLCSHSVLREAFRNR